MQPIETETIHALFEVKSVKHVGGLWRVHLKTYAGSVAELILYWGGEECPCKVHDYYQTDDADHGGWKLTRSPQEDIDLLNGQREAYAALSPAEKAKRTREMRKKLRTLDQDREARLKRRRAAETGEPVCPAVWWADAAALGYKMPEVPCQFVEGHSGSHWNGRGAGRGYEWDDDDLDSIHPTDA